jgi:hypothetical protein
MPTVHAPLVGEDPCHVGFGGGLQQLGLGIASRDCQRDDERVLAFQSFDKLRVVRVVDRDLGNAGRQLTCRVGASDGGDRLRYSQTLHLMRKEVTNMLAALQKRLRDESTASASSLFVGATQEDEGRHR